MSPSLQCLFLVWCMAPISWNGSHVLYQNVIRPCFLKHHQTVDHVLSDLSSKALDTASTVTREGTVSCSLSLFWPVFSVTPFLCLGQQCGEGR